MDEIVMGSKDPVSVTDVGALIERYSDQVHRAMKEGKELRRRVLNGEQKVALIKKQLADHAPIPYTWDHVADAEARLSTYREALRETDALLCMGMAAALAKALGEALGDFGQVDGWQPPKGSVLRLYMPGLLNLGMKLE